MYQVRVANQDDTVDYNSGYLGIGLRGDFTKDSVKGEEGEKILSYALEAAYEFGKTPEMGTYGKKNIQALGFDSEIALWLHSDTEMRLFTTYSFASGDKDRNSSNISETIFNDKDKMFYTFSDIDTGFVFRPGFSNIHIITAGYRIVPKIQNKYSIDISLRYSKYYKHIENAPIEINEIQSRGGDLGSAIDLFTTFSYKKYFDFFIDAGIYLPKDGPIKYR